MLKYVLMLALCCVAVSARADTHGNLPGNPTVLQFQSSQFFKFFALTRVGEQVAPGTHDTYVVYGTSGQFSDKVLVLVEVGKDGEAVKGVLAVITRGFIDTPSTSTFARDFAKSFLLFATPAQDQSGVTGLAREIWTGVTPGVTRYVKHGSGFEPAQADPTTPASAAYRVFTGQQPSADLVLDDCAISLRNGADPGKQPALTIAVEPRHG